MVRSSSHDLGVRPFKPICRPNYCQKEIMTVKQVAEYLQFGEHGIYKLARSGQIPSIKIAGQM